MSLWIIAIVILVGMVLLTLEIVALPGGIAGVCGGIFACVGIISAYKGYGSTAGTIALVATIVLGIALLVFFMKKRTWKHFSLDSEMDGKVNTHDSPSIFVGATGVTVSRLAPMGTAEIGGNLVEVSTISDFIDPNQEIEVLSVEENKIFVKLKTQSNV